MTGGRRTPSVWDRIMASRHRRSILGSLAVLALLVVVLIAGFVQGGSAPSTPPGRPTPVSSTS